MAEASEADRYLLDAIARGDTAAWSQLVARYQGRLLAFAKSRTSPTDAEDLVQETFLLFLQSFRSFRRDASLETFLFTILRRRMIDQYRGSRRHAAVCAIQDAGDAADEQPLLNVEQTPSWYLRQDEQTEQIERAVAAGIEGMIKRLRDGQRFDELRAIEMLFYAQLRNAEVADRIGMEPRQVAMLKHRSLQQVREHAATKLKELSSLDTDSGDSLLTRVWEHLRPTCPKRSTLGRLLLGTLDEPWRQYVDFHVNQLGCRFCQANLEDLRKESTAAPTQLREKIFQSTVGFLSFGGASPQQKR
jgi:RNA polymerase sigma factor (sigma-70 family)